MPVARSVIRVKAMLVTPSADGTAHAVSLNPPTAENPDGYHRLIGGGVELGETALEALRRARCAKSSTRASTASCS